jgi:hypothetical protein
MGINRTLLGILFVVSGLLVSGCQSSDRSKAAQKVQDLWSETVAVYLKKPLWHPMQNYDAAHMLMLPLHCAYDFCPGKTDRFKGDFKDFFDRFSREYAVPLDTNPLRESQFLYLVSQYLVLSAGSGDWGDVEQTLYDDLYRSLEYFWERRPSPHWAYSSDFPNAKSRLEWKLVKEKTDWRFFRAIIDEEYFLMSIAADLQTVARLCNLPVNPTATDMLDTALRVFASEGRFSDDGRWLMQPGVWSDHKDYRYAGHSSLKPGLEPAIMPDISMDTSHSHRMPLWLESLRSGFQGTENEQLFARILSGFRRQFLEVAWQPPGGGIDLPVVTNYINGHNGIYRYNYTNAGDSLGYGPFELSYSLFQGWYSFLGGTELRKGYNELAESFPLNQHQIEFYLGPDTKRIRHPLMTGSEFYTEGMAEITVNLSVLKASDPQAIAEATD